MFRTALRLLALALALALSRVPLAAAQGFVNFESGPVRPLALSPDGTRLFAVNTPDNRLEIFTVGAGGLARAGSVQVGLEPVAVAARSNTEVWVVNHLSDSVSVVDVASTPPRVTRTLLTCDEPRDIVFAGPAGDRAFVTTARRGQNCPVPNNLNDPGFGRAIVQVFDPTSLDATLEGTPIANVVLFGDSPRALARSADGNTVFAGIFHSGNETTAISEPSVCDGGAAASPCGAFPQRPGGLPAPNMNVENVVGPEVGLIVRFNRGTSLWEDELGRDWSSAVRIELPDQDVFAIDAAAAVPVETSSFAHVGTVLFNMVANPVSGKVYVSNTEALNEVRFEGPGVAFGSTTVQGHLHEARITVLDGATVTPRHLNKHIDYNIRPAPPGVKEKSLATPVGMAVSSDGGTLYVAAFGSGTIGVFDTAALENDTFVPDAGDHIALTGGGPTGLVLDEPRGRLYVATRFDDSISVVDVGTRLEVAHVGLHDPEPAPIRSGRRFLYDAAFTSSNGEASCSSCHVFGDLDSLAWDLGNPDDVVLNNPIPVKIPPLGSTFEDFHPLKGPMTTQSLRGMANGGSMHWRGDRTGGNDPGGDSFDEDAAFKKFNVAFPGLIGREDELTAAEMQAFTDFILTVNFPPNPIRDLDNSLANAEQIGHDLFFGPITDALFNCDGCHRTDPSLGFFGTDGFSTFEGETQMFKVPHLRNLYSKVGMFGTSNVGQPQGPQIRGFGFLHDGSIGTVRRFLAASVFTLTNQEQNQLERFIFVFDSNMNPIVGQQITLDGPNALVAGPRLDLMLQRDDLLECEVVVKGAIAGQQRGGYRLPDGTFQMDRAVETMTEPDLRLAAAVPGQELTYTCAPPGSGQRMGVDRDQDGILDRDELDVGSDPADPLSRPPTNIRSSAYVLRDDDNPPIDAAKRRISFRSSTLLGVPPGIPVPAWGSAGDPTAGGASGGGALLIIYNANGGTDQVRIPLPAVHWTRAGKVDRPKYNYRDRFNLDGPITSMAVGDGKLSIRGKGAALYGLAGAPQGVMGIRVRLATGVELCAAAPAAVPTPENDSTNKFGGTRNTAAPAPCPAVP